VNGFAGSPPRVTLDVMLGRPAALSVASRTQFAALGAALLMLAADIAWPQAASPPSSAGVQAPAQQAAPDRPAPSSPPPPREDNPGVLNEMGKLFEKSLSIMPSMKSPSETLDDLNARAKDAGETLSRMAKPSSMVTGRMVCPASANSAPDCKTASDKLCRTKGFKEGRSISNDSAEACSAKVLIPGRIRKPDDCRTDHYVTRALCQ
jgi:hypothetical protein